jgi:uroporphyrinogen-III synthase
MKLIVTRPMPDAQILHDKLCTLGHVVDVMPLLEIVPQKSVNIPNKPWQAICVTSANAARCFSAQSMTASREEPEHLPEHLDEKWNIPVLAVGAQSRDAARSAGFNNVTDHGGDVAGLVAYIHGSRKPEDGPILYLSGRETSGDLKGELEHKGFTVHRAIVYETATISHSDFSARLSACDGVLLYSPRTALMWSQQIAHHEATEIAANKTHFCLSANVARKLNNTWPAVVAVTPTEQSMLDLIERMGEEAKLQ